MPAHTIKYRFSEDVIQQLLSYDISSIKPDKKIKQLLYSKIDSNNIISVLKKIEESGLIKKKSEISYEKGIFSIAMANVICMALGLITNFLLPKHLSVNSYAMLKTYSLYMNYAGFFALGYSDSVYLKYGGKNLEI